MGRIFVAGSINMDMTVQVDRRPQLGETIVGNDVDFVLGGKGSNQAIAAGRTGSEVLMIGRLGEDNVGDDLAARLEQKPISLEYVQRDPDAPSGMAFITVDADSENAIIIIPGSNERVAPADVTDVPMESGDVAVSQFEVPQVTIRAFFETARDAGATTVLNPAPADEFREPILPLVDYLVVNETEALFYSDANDELPLSEDELLETCADLRTHEAQVVIVTLGSDGVLASTSTETVTLDAHAVDPVDTTGAGDAFVGAFATAINEGRELRKALAFANAAGAVATTTIGASSSLPERSTVESTFEGS